jgi:hypothetical protein
MVPLKSKLITCIWTLSVKLSMDRFGLVRDT